MSGDSAIEWEAAQWVALQMGGQPFDREAFDAWLLGDPRRAPVFDTMWRRIMGPTMDEALGGAAARSRARRTTRLTTAACAAIALLGGYQALPSLALLLAEPKEYSAAGGGLLDVDLEDGTRLTLAGGTQVRVRYTRYARELDLRRGTIFASVARDEERPFRVAAGASRVVVLGTRFEVSTSPASTFVSVASGMVRFGPDGWFRSAVDLGAHQAAVVDEAGLHRLADLQPDSVAKWREEWAEYHEAPLGQVIRDLEGLAPAPIVIADERLADLKVSGRIRLTDPLRQLDNLSVIHDFTIRRRDGAIVVSRE